ncbi:Amidohydrolase family protein [Methylobacterium sp. UNC300MFChir4.1]|nr:Amidohydrolase family protein [Methylobacterium sp. UNC300MFChir4.1]
MAGNDRHRALLDVSVLFPGGAIASDAVPWLMPDGATYLGDAWPLPAEAVSHPRSSGTFTRFLREWVRERATIPLLEGLAKCTLVPAQILESSTPAMRRKGRIQVGCDADIVCLDWQSLTDKADFRHPNRPSEGVRHLMVGGAFVIRDSALTLDIRPGQAIRRAVLP